MTLKPYPVYRESGYEWFGQVPSHWTVASMKRGVNTGAGSGFPHEYQNERDGEIPFLKVNSLAKADADGVIRWSQETVSKTVASVLRATIFPAGSLVIAKIGAALLLGRIRILGADSCIDNNMMALAPLADTKSRFLYYAMTLVDFYWLVNPGAVPSTSEGAVAEFPLPFPPLEEQAQIADYLDIHTAKIDTLIGKQEQLIETLAERRQAVISHAVTKGLDPNAPKKDSGYEWVGLIPAHWKSAPFVRLTSGRVDYRGATPRKTTEGVQLITARNVKKGYIDREASREYVSIDDYSEVMRRGLPEIGDVLLTMEAPLGNVALVDDVDVAFAQRVIKFRLDREELLPEFANYLLNGFQFQQQILSKATGSTALGLKASKLIELFVAVPPVAEQESIAKTLDASTAQMDALAAKAREMIDALKERRQALISAAVTGKIDVRGRV